MKQASLMPAMLRQLRQQKGLSAKAVTSLLQEKGICISEKTLLGYENGVGTPKVNTFLCLCEIYNVGDVMQAFGYSSMATSDSGEWHLDMYNDFFNAPLLDKIYLLLRNGVPSFDGYQDKLEAMFPSDSEKANFDKLYYLFSQLTEAGQSVAIHRIKELLQDPDYIKSPLLDSPTSATSEAV